MRQSVLEMETKVVELVEETRMKSRKLFCLFAVLVALISTPASAQSYILSPNLVGYGNVTSTDGYINCTNGSQGETGTCSHNYPSGTYVYMNATAASGWTFQGWAGFCSGGNPCEVQMNQNLSPTATFTQNTYTLTPILVGYGNVTSTDGYINCTNGSNGETGTCSYNYPSGTKVTMNATAASGWTFQGWSSNQQSCNGGNPCVLYMNQSSGATATFVSGQPFISGVCPATTFSSNTNLDHGTFFIYGGNFQQGSFVTTNGALLLYNNAIVNKAGTLVRQDYQIEGDGTPTFDLWVNTPQNGSAETSDTTTVYSTEPLYSLCGLNGSWEWTPPSYYCPSGGCPFIGYIELNADLYNMNSGANGNLSMSYSGGQLSTTVNLSGLNVPSGAPIVGYPNLEYGYQPCPTCRPTPPITDFKLPTQVYKFPDAWSMVNYSISPPSQGKMDLAFDIWVTKLHKPTDICQDDVELMIWLYNTPSYFLPAGTLVGTFNLPTFVGGSIEYPTWQAYLGMSGSGGGKSCTEKGKATVVSLLLPANPTQYVGVGLSNALTAMIDTLVTYGQGFNGQEWTAAKLERYYVNDINVGSEFGCDSKKQQCSNFQMNYSYSIPNYCFVIGDGSYNWSEYACPASLGMQ